MGDRAVAAPSDHPRVLWLIRGLGPGGAERLLVAQARAGSGRFAYEVAYQVAAKDQLVPELEAAGVTVHLIGQGATWPLGLRHLVADRRISLVHSHSPAMAVGARLALRALPGGGRPGLVYTEHNRWNAYHRATRTGNALTYALEHRVLSVSEEARRSVAGPLRRRVRTLHHGVDGAGLRAAVGGRAATRAALGIRADEVLAVQVANFRAEKAHEVLVEAARLLADAGAPIRIAMVGQGPRQAEIEALVRQRGLEGTVQVLGFRDDVATLLAAADALVLSSDHEGLPVAVMEALALGVPVVATAVGGIPEAIRDGVEGLLVPPRDPAALATALQRFAAEPALREVLRRGAAARAPEFEASHAAARIEATYDEVLAGRRPRR